MDKKDIQLNLSRNHVTRQKSKQTHRSLKRADITVPYTITEQTNNFFWGKLTDSQWLNHTYWGYLLNFQSYLLMNIIFSHLEVFPC